MSQMAGQCPAGPELPCPASGPERTGAGEDAAADRTAQCQAASRAEHPGVRGGGEDPRGAVPAVWLWRRGEHPTRLLLATSSSFDS